MKDRVITTVPTCTVLKTSCVITELNIIIVMM